MKGLADVLEALGSIRAEQSLVSSEGLFKEALELREKTSGPESPEAATSLSFLASINFFRQNFDKASELYARTLASVAKSVEHLIERHFIERVQTSSQHADSVRFATVTASTWH